MSQILNEAEALFEVVVNHEEQYSLLPQEKAVPAGWRKCGKLGSRAECLAYIDEAWSDIRPLSVRTQAA